jgi:hypothetical protein
MPRALSTALDAILKLDAAICLLGIGLVAQALAQAAPPDADCSAASASRDAATNILEMIPEDVESILVVRRIRAPVAPKGRTIIETRVADGKAVQVRVDERGKMLPIYQHSFEEMSLAFNTHLLGLVDHGRFESQWLRAEKLAATVFAARRYQDGNRGKTTSYEGCLFIAFVEAIAPAAIEALRASEKPMPDGTGGSIIKVSPQPVLGNQLPQEAAPVYLQQAAPNLLIAANNLDLLKEIAARRRAESDAWVTKTEERKYVDRDAPVWGLRHYRPETKRSSRTSLLAVEPTVVGMILGYKPTEAGHNVIAHFLCRGTLAEAAIRRFYPEGSEWPLARISQGQTTIDVAFHIDQGVHPRICFDEMIAPLGYLNEFYAN